MNCPFCRNTDSRVVDSRSTEDGTSIRRRRQCPECGRRFSTLETASLTVVKRSGATEPFSRSKVISGVRKACQGRPVGEDDLARLAQRVEESIRVTGAAEIDAHEVGLSILGPLRELDEVAYLRFASVYRAFDSLEDFEDAISLLRVERDAMGVEPLTVARPRRPRRRRRLRTPVGGATGEGGAADGNQPTATFERSPSSTHSGSVRPTRARGARMTRGNNRYDRDRVRPRGSQDQGRQPASQARRPDDRPGVHHARRPPVRRGHLGTSRRRPDELEERRDDLRAEGCGVPGLLEPERLDHRHHQVLPGGAGHRRARVEPAPVDRPGRSDLRQGRQGRGLLRHRRRRRGV